MLYLQKEGKSMNTTVLDITLILSQDLKSRSAVKDLLLYIKNLEVKAIKIDFANVQFATRSFIDEYYNQFIKNTSALKIETINISDDIQALFKAVSQTQNGERKMTISSSSVSSFNTVTDLNSYLSTLTI
jgi:uncharacterized protein (DUF2164 family)